MKSYEQWRERVEEIVQRGEFLETIAKDLGDFPWEVNPMFGHSIQWHEESEELHDFVKRVESVKRVLGDPDKVVTDERVGHAPDLIARWNMEKDNIRFSVVLRAWWPKGCKIDPRTPGQSPEYSRIHPECAAVLDELR